jgi:hypothetical protein
MEEWLNYLKADPRNWLSEADNPSVRYLAMTELATKPISKASIKKAKREIMTTGPVPIILFKQNDDGYWETVEGFYDTKYRGTVWQLLVLAELYADGNDNRIKQAVEFILNWSQDRESGGFATRGSLRGGQRMAVIPCLTGNMVWSLLRLGYFEDPRVQKGIEWITKYQRYDDGIEKGPSGWPYERKTCWGRHTCHMGVVKSLKALAEIPPDRRSEPVKQTIKSAAEYLLKHHLFKKSHELSQVAKPAWLNLGFPLMWNTDVLEMLDVLTALGYHDMRMQEAIDLVITKQDEQGKWNLENTFNGRFQVNIEKKGKPSKWVTLNALRVLRGYLEEQD